MTYRFGETTGFGQFVWGKRRPKDNSAAQCLAQERQNFSVECKGKSQIDWIAAKKRSRDESQA